jgi:sterol desaturase/sphingolipid hydroxylase (fatty acid hydroxylase superfamily)
MQIFGSIQSTLVLVLGVLALGCEVFALVDALRHRPDAFAAAGKRTKTFWAVVLAVALAIGIIVVLNVLNFIGILAFVAAAVYLVDVRPALRQVSGRGRTTQGPYGPW